MARRKLTLEEQLKGVRAAVKSRRTPPQLKEGLKRWGADIERKLQAEGRSPQRTRPARKHFDFMWD